MFLYHSIALKILYKKSFESNRIGASDKSWIDEKIREFQLVAKWRRCQSFTNAGRYSSLTETAILQVKWMTCHCANEWWRTLRINRRLMAATRWTGQFNLARVFIGWQAGPNGRIIRCTRQMFARQIGEIHRLHLIRSGRWRAEWNRIKFNVRRIKLKFTFIFVIILIHFMPFDSFCNALQTFFWVEFDRMKRSVAASLKRI